MGGREVACLAEIKVQKEEHRRDPFSIICATRLSPLASNRYSTL